MPKCIAEALMRSRWAAAASSLYLNAIVLKSLLINTIISLCDQLCVQGGTCSIYFPLSTNEHIYSLSFSVIAIIELLSISFVFVNLPRWHFYHDTIAAAKSEVFELQDTNCLLSSLFFSPRYRLEEIVSYFQKRC